MGLGEVRSGWRQGKGDKLNKRKTTEAAVVTEGISTLVLYYRNHIESCLIYMPLWAQCWNDRHKETMNPCLYAAPDNFSVSGKWELDRGSRLTGEGYPNSP